MSIPLDRLYHYIETLAEEIYGSHVIIYRFHPHGSKKLQDLIPSRYYEWKELTLYPKIYCNDQELLDYKLYQNLDYPHACDNWTELVNSLPPIDYEKNLKRIIDIYDQSLLLHSEQRSNNLIKYQTNQWQTIYYWSHALLAIDWFRYARYATIKQKLTKKFLIYNRAWTGTREYRLKFADLLIDHGLVYNCQTSVGFTDQNIYYKNYNFINSDWRPTHTLENYFDVNSTSSTSSADFTIEDYENTSIEVVLETLFDDERLHLTEKSLRPIACGQPFILAATHGSLEYLRNYGFKTFDSIIDESYDQIKDPTKRLQAIVLVMKQIANWAPDESQYKIRQLQQIAEYNRKHFFSNEFVNQVMSELKENLSTALSKFKNNKNCGHWIQRWNQLLTNKSVQHFLEVNQNNVLPTKQQVDSVYQEAIKYIK